MEKVVHFFRDIFPPRALRGSNNEGGFAAIGFQKVLDLLRPKGRQPLSFYSLTDWTRAHFHPIDTEVYSRLWSTK
jgi:hypothetical protein